MIEVERCGLTLNHVELVHSDGSAVLNTRDDSTVAADRIYVHGNFTAPIVVAGARQTFRVTNSLFLGVQLVAFLSDTAPPGSHLEFSHSTFIQPSQNARHPLCAGNPAPNISLRFENIISVPLDGFDAFNAPNSGACTFVGTILGRQTTPPPGTIVVDPQFVDALNGDFHLKPTSPAVDAAASGVIDVTEDLDGIQRPQGSAADIGAYELPQ